MSTKTPIIQWRQLSPVGECYHVARARFHGRNACRLHAQDYPELFWLEQGRCLHRINHQRETLVRGDLVFVRAVDCHGFSAVDTGGFVLVNVAFAPDSIDHLHQRYFPDENRFFWNREATPYRQRLSDGQLERLGQWVRYLDQAAHTRLPIEWMLLNVLHLLETEASPVVVTEPAWLAEALRAIEQPEHFRNGVQALAMLAGRSPEHVNAVLRAKLGQTATDVVNAARMRYAAHRLRMGTGKILEVCYDCGLENLSYFYRLFQKRYGMTPRAYRLHHRATIE